MKWNPNGNQANTVLAAFNPTHPQEKILLGIVSRPSRRLSLFAELKAGPDNKTDFLAGYRVNFQEGTLTGTMTSGFKATSVYRRVCIDMFQLSFQSMVDFSKPQSPAQFGVSMSFGGMWAWKKFKNYKYMCENRLTKHGKIKTVL